MLSIHLIPPICTNNHISNPESSNPKHPLTRTAPTTHLPQPQSTHTYKTPSSSSSPSHSLLARLYSASHLNSTHLPSPHLNNPFIPPTILLKYLLRNPPPQKPTSFPPHISSILQLLKPS